MGKIEIVKDLKRKREGLKNIKNNRLIVPCNYYLNTFQMVSDVDELIPGIYVLKNRNFNYEEVVGIYFKRNDYLYSLSECQVTFFHYTDFNVLFTHDYNSHEYKSAIIFDNTGKFITSACIHKIVEYDKTKIDEFGILTDSNTVYLIDNEFYIYTKAKYPLVKQSENTYPFTRLKDRVFDVIETEFGQKAIDADSILELDYKYDLVKDKMKDAYIESSYLQEKYPKIKRR